MSQVPMVPAAAENAEVVPAGSSKPSPELVQRRLEILWHKLDGEGMYVGANTVHLAQVLIASLTGVGPSGR